MANAIRRAIWEVDKDQPVWGVDSFDGILARIGAHGLPQLISSVLGGYAALALILASIGIFGVVSYSVTQRTGEIGVRMALGARPADVAKLILRQGFSLATTRIAVDTGRGVHGLRDTSKRSFTRSARSIRLLYSTVAAVLAETSR